MPRLPIPGSDDNSWGTILNNYLSVEHNPDGSLKKASDIVTAQTTADNAQATATAKYTKPSGGIPTSDLAASGASSGQTMVFTGGQWQPVSAMPVVLSYETVPADHLMKLWTYNPRQIVNSVTPIISKVHLSRMWLPVSATINQLGVATRTGGTGATPLAGCYLALFNKNGTRLGITADQSSNWGDGLYGFKSSNLIPDFAGSLDLVGGPNEYVFAALFMSQQSTTVLTLGADAQGNSIVPNIGLVDPSTGNTFLAGAIPNSCGVPGTVSAMPATVDMTTVTPYLHVWYGAL